MTTTVEDNCFDLGINGALGDEFADGFSGCFAGSGRLDLLIESRGGTESLTRDIIDDLGVDVFVGEVNSEAGTPGSSGNLFPNAAVHLAAEFLSIESAH